MANIKLYLKNFIKKHKVDRITDFQIREVGTAKVVYIADEVAFANDYCPKCPELSYQGFVLYTGDYESNPEPLWKPVTDCIITLSKEGENDIVVDMFAQQFKYVEVPSAGTWTFDVTTVPSGYTAPAPTTGTATANSVNIMTFDVTYVGI